MSNTRSAVREMPRAEDETMVITGWSTSRRSGGATRRGARPGSGRWCRVSAIGAAARSPPVPWRSRPRPAGRVRADGGGGSRRSGGSARTRRSRGRGFPGVRLRSTGAGRAGRADRSRGCAVHADRDRHLLPGLTLAVDELLRRAVGRLSTQSQPISSSASSTVDLPAPDMPVTSSRRGSGLDLSVTVKT